MEKAAALVAFVGVFAVAIGAGLLLGFPVMWLWNWVMVPMGLPAVTFWKAWGLIVLGHFIFPSHPTSK